MSYEWTVAEKGKAGCAHPSFRRVTATNHPAIEVCTCDECGRRLARKTGMIDDVWPEHRET